ncbi:MAG: [protein-PII] uridylyltransferase [Flavobacteriales bacterium]|jgi:[protein-PII] uridylyltransferase
MWVDQVPEYASQPICFNQKQFRVDLRSKPCITTFKDALHGVYTHFDRRFCEGEDIRSLVYERANFIDVILHYAWHQHKWNNDIALIAVGGYGRKELHPRSDIDLLILISDDSAANYDEQLQSFITFLWDIGLEIGSSVRTLKECLEIAREDITVATNVMEARCIAGDDDLRDKLQLLSGPEYMWPLKDFFRAKWEEQVSRHNKHNNTESNLEPNIKNAPGGLRDLQMINWIAKRFYSVQTILELQGKDFFTEDEFATIQNCEEFLWRVRYGVHMITNRAEERLLFEHQRELAVIFNYEDDDARLGVEKFMQRYYRRVIALRELNDVLLQSLEERINGDTNKPAIVINERFQLRENYIEVTAPDVFDKEPSALLEVFVLMGNNPIISGVHAETIRLIRDKRKLITKKFRDNPKNKALFLEIFSINYGLVTQLTRMKRYGILGRYLPAFKKISGQMQHDLFHRYTVDAHTLLVIQNMRRFTLPEEKEKFPIAAHVINNIPKKELLYIAGLFHDIGKGRGGDHSSLGAVDAEKFCSSHGLKRSDSSLVSWLVEKHLLMSYVSQKQDLSDPEVIHNFALEVRDQRRLDYLYALTVADMCGTNPEIWNSWRASLMRELYLVTKRALRRGLENTADKHDIIEETQAMAMAKLIDKGVDENEARQLWESMGEEYFVRESHIDIAWHTEALVKHNTKEPLILIHQSTSSRQEGATQIFVWAHNAQHVFSATTSCLAQLNLIIQDAKIYQSNSGYTLDTFYVLNDDFDPIGDNENIYQDIRSALLEELSLVGEYSETVKRRVPRELKQFAIPTRTSISNDIVGAHTVLEVTSPDRPSLLANIAHVFMEHDIIVQNAKISTLGERIEDVFFITDIEGHPLSDPDICAALRKSICKRLDRHVEKELKN